MEAKSEHFRVLSDLSIDDAVGIARELEDDLAALEQVALSRALIPVDPTTVVVFSGEADFHAFAVTQAGEALAKVARSAAQLHALALLQLDLRKAAEALTFAERSVALAPVDSEILDGKALVLDALGRFDDAVREERAAIAFLPDGTVPPMLTQHLTRFELHARQREP